MTRSSRQTYRRMSTREGQWSSLGRSRRSRIEWGDAAVSGRPRAVPTYPLQQPSGYLSPQRFGSRMWLGPVPAVPLDVLTTPLALHRGCYTKGPRRCPPTATAPLGLKGPDVPGPGGTPAFETGSGASSCGDLLAPFAYPLPPRACHTAMARAQAFESPPPPWPGETHHAPTRTLVRSSWGEPSKTVVLCGFSVASPGSSER